MIARLTGVPAGSLHRELRQLAGAGLVVAAKSGNQLLYGANERSPVFHELSSVLDKTAGTPPTLHEHAAEYTVEPSGRLPEIDKQALARICRKYGVKKLSLFGSAARDELRPDSDVDLMVEFKPTSTSTLFDLVRMQEELSPIFGNRKVETTSPEILRNPYRRRTIEKDLRTLYAAR
ncbi:MAG: nucleotidyltransferase domain-containing protein [Burkholderiales bacterium]|nr:nucleotidyltransferase domain-containing protein [Burkholderiales bacterium]